MYNMTYMYTLSQVVANFVQCLTLFILMDDPIHIDTVSLELSIRFLGATGRTFYKMMYYVPEDVFFLF